MAPNCADFKRRQRCPGRFITSCTDSNNADSDFDGLSDLEEGQIGTDPGDADSDDDGLLDREEADGVADPVDSDSDDNGSPDGVDTDPDNPNVQDDEVVERLETT